MNTLTVYAMKQLYDRLINDNNFLEQTCDQLDMGEYELFSLFETFAQETGVDFDE